MSSKELLALLQEDWEWEMHDNPEFASQAGQKCGTSGHCLQDISLAGYMSRKAHSADMLKKIGELDFTLFGSDDGRCFAPLFTQMHKDIIDNIEGCPLYYLPINSMGTGGVCFSFLESVEWMNFESVSDYDSYLSRLESFPIQMEQFISVMKAGIAQGYVASTAMTRHVENQLEGIINGNFPELRAPLDSAVYKDNVASEIKDRIEAAISVIKKSFEAFLDFFHDEYLPHVSFNPSCAALPNGAEIYKLCLRYHTTTYMTADEIHEIGHQEVAKIEARYVTDVLLPLGYKADEFAKFVEFVRHDKQFYVNSSDELLAHYKATCAQISKIMPNYFNEIPTSPLEIVQKTVGPAAYYIAGTADGKRPGRFYVNCSEIEKRPLYESIALSLHEANPGHHHQCAVTMENDKLPNFMRFFEDRRYEVGAAKRSMATAYVEGWGLYTEYLGEEMELYTTPYELFGRFSMEMMRAVRLVVDTGIHHKGWSLEQAIDYMMAKTGMHRHEVETEIYRYATWPGQACAYKIGEIAILRLRRKAEAELGAKFNLKDFHTAVLQYGPVPLSHLENLVQHYINRVGPVADNACPAGHSGDASMCPVASK